MGSEGIYKHLPDIISSYVSFACICYFSLYQLSYGTAVKLYSSSTPALFLCCLIATVGLWSPCGIGQAIYIFILSFVMAALCNRAGHYIFAL